ncbi:MAG: GtrA family protein [Candidatus Staskawiczbacteria bacterium]|nr:GtrA family protein [Candidatus Staskawiczbacteria bacterium]
MKKIDIIFSAVCGLSVAWIALDFAPLFNGAPGRMTGWIFFVILPLLSIFGFWLTELVGRKFLFVHQVGKFVLVGAFADVIDIKVFQLLIIFAPFSSFVKAISFLAATVIKYWWNKHWAFDPSSSLASLGTSKGQGKNLWSGEVVKFFLVTLVGLAINVASFHYFGKIDVGMPIKTWTELCIIFSALVAAIWNFCGYKFLVFKK